MSHFIAGHRWRSSTDWDSAQILCGLFLCGLSSSCAIGPHYEVEGEHATVRASSRDTAQRVALAVDRAWDRTPREFTDPEVDHVQVELVTESGNNFNRTLFQIPLWGQPQLTMCLLDGSWARSVGHEVVHVRTLLRLKRVPAVLVEGLAEYWSMEPGPLREGLLAYADRVVSRAPMPYAYFELRRGPGDQDGRGIFDVLGSVDTDPDFDANLLNLSIDEIQHLGWSEMQIAYHLAHAMVHDYLALGPNSDIETLERLPDETASGYYERIGLGSLAAVRERSKQRAEDTPLIRAYWPRLVAHIDSWLRHYPQFANDPETFLEQTQAILEFQAGERIDLSAMQEFRELVRQVWRIGGGRGRSDAEGRPDSGTP